MEQMTKDQVLHILLQNNREEMRDKCVQYADIYLEYVEATNNINEHGVIVKHPRTMNPIENPYLKIRDKAVKKMQDYRRLNTKGLW